MEITPTHRTVAGGVASARVFPMPGIRGHGFHRGTFSGGGAGRERRRRRGPGSLTPCPPHPIPTEPDPLASSEWKPSPQSSCLEPPHFQPRQRLHTGSLNSQITDLLFGFGFRFVSFFFCCFFSKRYLFSGRTPGFLFHVQPGGRGLWGGRDAGPMEEKRMRRKGGREEGQDSPRPPSSLSPTLIPQWLLRSPLNPPLTPTGEIFP